MTEPTSSSDLDRAYWDRHAKRYDTSLKALDKPIARMLELIEQAVSGAGRETWVSWLLSRALATTGFPGHRRFSAPTLRQALVAAGFTIDRFETIPGPIPIGFVEGKARGAPLTTR